MYTQFCLLRKKINITHNVHFGSSLRTLEGVFLEPSLMGKPFAVRFDVSSHTDCPGSFILHKAMFLKTARALEDSVLFSFCTFSVAVVQHCFLS